MDLVDEKNDVLRLDDIIHHIFEPLLELTAIFRPCNECRHRECDDTFILKQERYLPVCDALGKPLRDRSLANPRLSEEEGIVLGTTCKDLDHAINLPRTPDHGIEPSRTGDIDQITPVLLERSGKPLDASPFRFLTCRLLL